MNSTVLPEHEQATITALVGRGDRQNLVWLVSCVIAFGVFLLSSSAAQQNPNPVNDTSSSTIRTRTELVLVPVVVTDKSGAHVSGLGLKDFEVREDGKLQQVTLFEEVVARGRSERLYNSGEYTNHVDDQAARRVTIILLDLLNTPYLSQEHARQELLKVLSAGLNDDDPKALLVLTRSGIVVVHDFTTDSAVLAAALRKAKGDPGTPGGVDAFSVALEAGRLNSFGLPGATGWDVAGQRSRIDKTVESLQDLAKAFAGVPGRKALIWASAGFPFSWVATPSRPVEPNLRSAPARSPLGSSFPVTPPILTYEKTCQLFNSANIAIYSVDLRGMVGEQWDYRDASVGGDGAVYQRWAKQNYEASTATLLSFAQQTGGKALVGFSDIAQSFRQALDDSRSYYLLGYYLNRTKTRTGWHKLAVNVARTGTDVRTRAGFLVAEAPSSGETDVTELVMTSPLDYTAVPLTLRLEPATLANGKKHVEFTLTVAPGGFTIDSANGNHAWIEVTAGVVDAKGAVKATKPQILDMHLKPESVTKIFAGGLVYRNSFDVAPGEYTGRIVVRDRLSGRVGSVSAPIKLLP